jgi:ATP-binding cassette subfamily B protein
MAMRVWHGGPMRGPGEEPERSLRQAISDRRVLRWAVSLFAPYRLQVAIVTAAILLSAGLGVANPLLIRATFDKALFVRGGPRIGLLLVLAGAMIAIPIVSSLVGVYQTYLTNTVGQSVMRNLRGTLYEHLQRMPLRFFTATRTGEIQSRLANDVGGLQTVITDTASSVLSNAVILLSTLVAMVVLSWQLTVLSLFLLPLFVYLTRRVGQARRHVTGQTQEALAEMSAITQETLSVSGVLLAKVFGRQRVESARYAEQNERLARLQVRQQMIGRSFFAVVSTFFSITPALVYLVAGLTYSRGGQLSPGTLVAFTTLQARLFMPIGQVLQISTEVASSLALFSRIRDYLDLQPDIQDAPGADALPKGTVRGEVRLDNVWFSYQGAPAPDGDGARPGAAPKAAAKLAPDGVREVNADGGRRWALRDVDLRVEPGMLAAIVGPSGAGKTTISYLIPRLYDTTAGRVLLDGHDVRELTLTSLSDVIGMVTQESYLFHASVRQNLAYARPGATDEELVAAAQAAYIHDRIMELDEGYDTVVGERGYRLSGGEKQRLAIARVILKNPRVLILDEATSALDTASERIVQAALRPLMQERTTIAIAHRLSTILAADVIFVLERGRLVEQGSHPELLETGGLYRRLYDEQFGGGMVEARCHNGLVMASGQVIHLPEAEEPLASSR